MIDLSIIQYIICMIIGNSSVTLPPVVIIRSKKNLVKKIDGNHEIEVVSREDHRVINSRKEVKVTIRN